MKRSNRVRRVAVASGHYLETAALSQPEKGNGRVSSLWRSKLRGQALIIIALSGILLVAAVGLAVDGGSMYTERRTAQNAMDSASLAGTKLFLKQLQAALQISNPPPAGTADQ